jgi:hypothetical protein
MTEPPKFSREQTVTWLVEGEADMQQFREGK